MFEGTAELADGAEPGVEFDGTAELPEGMAYPLEGPAELGPAEDTGNEVGTESVLLFEGVAELPDVAEPRFELEGAPELPGGIAYPLDEEPAELGPAEDRGSEVGTESVLVFEGAAELPDVAEPGVELDGAAKLPDGMAYPLDEEPAELGPAEDTGNEVGTESVLVFEGINELAPELEGVLYPPDEAPLEVETATVVVETGVPGTDAVTKTLETGTSELGLLNELIMVPGGLGVGGALEGGGA